MPFVKDRASSAADRPAAVCAACHAALLRVMLLVRVISASPPFRLISITAEISSSSVPAEYWAGLSARAAIGKSSSIRQVSRALKSRLFVLFISSVSSLEGLRLLPVRGGVCGQRSRAAGYIPLQREILPFAKTSGFRG